MLQSSSCLHPTQNRKPYSWNDGYSFLLINERKWHEESDKDLKCSDKNVSSVKLLEYNTARIVVDQIK